MNKKISDLNFDGSKSKEYKMKATQNNVVYANKPENYLPGF